jgi:hypothetical protein
MVIATGQWLWTMMRRDGHSVDRCLNDRWAIAYRLDDRTGRFEKMYKDLEAELNAKKAAMDVIMQQSHAAFAARQAAHEQMVRLKTDADHEQSEFEKKWDALGQMIENDKKNKDKDSKKAVDPSAASDAGDVAGGRSSGKGTSIAAEERNLKTKVAKGAWGIARDRANIHLSMAKVQSYEEAFAKIQNVRKTPRQRTQNSRAASPMRTKT